MLLPIVFHYCSLAYFLLYRQRYISVLQLHNRFPYFKFHVSTVAWDLCALLGQAIHCMALYCK